MESESTSKLLIAGEPNVCSQLKHLLQKKYKPGNDAHDLNLEQDSCTIQIENKYFLSTISLETVYVMADTSSHVETNYVKLGDDEEETSSTFKLTSNQEDTSAQDLTKTEK